MHETKKLDEANYFYSRMMEEQKNRNTFIYNLSAFLSAARSVLQYALKEAEHKAGGEKWYKSHISASPVLKFFKDKRDFNIHTEPVHAQAQHSVNMAATGSASVSLSYIVFDKDGKIKQQSSPDCPQEKSIEKPKESENSSRHEVRYKFGNWTGNEDILTLCQRYIQEIDVVIKDGVAKGFLTGLLEKQ